MSFYNLGNAQAANIPHVGAAGPYSGANPYAPSGGGMSGQNAALAGSVVFSALSGFWNASAQRYARQTQSFIQEANYLHQTAARMGQTISRGSGTGSVFGKSDYAIVNADSRTAEVALKIGAKTRDAEKWAPIGAGINAGMQMAISLASLSGGGGG